MIKIERKGDYTQITVSGRSDELFNDCRSLIKSVYMNTDFGEVFLEAWNSVIKEREEKND